MKTLKRTRTLVLGIGLFAAGVGQAQVSAPTNNASTGDYVGCDGTSPFPLEVRQNDNYPIQWFTDSLQRMQLYHTNSATLNTFTVPRNGFLAVSPVKPFYTNPGPFSRLHLVDSTSSNPIHYAQDFGFRPWMRNGVTMTGNSDQMYIGHKYAYVDSVDYTSGEINDRSDAVIEWSDNPDDAPWGTDRMRFMFTNDHQVASPKTYGARSLEGMEAMRIFIPTDTTAHVGIGDFFRAGVINGQNEDPTERLHVNDGTVRIDSLIPDYQDDTLHQVLMSDMQGRVHWRNINTWPPTGGSGTCEWGSDAPTGRIYTAFQTNGSNGTCPEEDWKVGIGQPWPAAKLDVSGKQSMIGANVAINAALRGAAGVVAQQVAVVGSVDAETTIVPNPVGISGTINKVGTTGYAVQGTANVNATGVTSTGTSAVYGRVNASAGTTGALYGTRGEVSNTGTSITSGSAYGSYGSVSGSATMQNTYGMYGLSTATGTQTNSYGGYAVSTRGPGASVGTSTGLFAGSNGAPNVTNSYGVNASASGGTTNTIGVNSVAFGVSGTTNTYAVYGQGLGHTTNSIGVYGRSANSGAGTGITRIGVFGNTNYSVLDTLATNISVYGDYAGGGPNQWAGYFPGRTFSPTGFWTASDEQLKTDISEIAQGDTDPVAKLLSLTPRSYQFNVAGFPQLGLPRGQQYGFLAPDLEEQFPEMVTDVVQPARYDSTGAEITAALPFKAVNTSGLLPLAIEAIKRQEARIAQLEEMVASCCMAAVSGHRVSSDPASGSTNDLETDLRIIPNPVADRTELRYTVGTEGTVRLAITGPDGRTLLVQDEGTRATGTYSYAWDTTALAPGTYHCTLYVNGELVVRKAVKLNSR